MKQSVAVISDIHGNLPALEAVWEDIEKNGGAEVYNCGDSLDGPLWPEETAKFLIDRNVISIRGNGEDDMIRGYESDASIRDGISPATYDWLRSLEVTLRNNCDWSGLLSTGRAK